MAAKGQLISKCLFVVIVFDQNSNENIVRISALKFFIASLRLPGSFLGLPVGPRKPKTVFRKPTGSYKKFQGRNPYKIFVAILVETVAPKRHFEINRPLVKKVEISKV